MATATMNMRAVTPTNTNQGGKNDTHLAELEHVHNDSNVEAYHAIAAKAKLSALKGGDKSSQSLFQYLISSKHSGGGNGSVENANNMTVRKAKASLLKELMKSSGDTTTRGFQLALDQLLVWSSLHEFDANHVAIESCDDGNTTPKLEGTWITLSKPQFSDCRGVNNEQDFLYTLGWMSFDMFCPTQLNCSIQGCFNKVQVMTPAEVKQIKHVPSSLKKELGESLVRTYDIVTAFTIEAETPDSDPSSSPNYGVNEPIQAVMVTKGYIIPNPHPKLSSRVTIWFTGGSIELSDKTNTEDKERWNHVFDDKKMPKRAWSERSKLFVAGLIMGATSSDKLNADGKMTYDLKRPIGGHDTAFVEVLYMDETIRIARANTGVIYVFARVP